MVSVTSSGKYSMGLLRKTGDLANAAYAPIKQQLQRYYRPRQYIRRFGKAEGLRIYELLYDSAGPDEVAVRIPGYAHPIHVRKSSSDVRIFQGMFLKDEYGIKFPFEPKTILDGGANVGYASIYFAKAYPDAKIVAVEPEESNFHLLRKNTQFYPNVSCLKSAIWGHSTHLHITNPDDEKWNIQVEECDPGAPDSFRACSIEDAMRDHRLENIDILKLDIEGGEMNVFESNPESWIGKVGAMVIELHEDIRPGCSRVFNRAVKPYNFTRTVVGENQILISQNR